MQSCDCVHKTLIDQRTEYARFRPITGLYCTKNDKSIISYFSSCFVNEVTDHNSQRILMYYGSKDVVWRKDVPFEYP